MNNKIFIDYFQFRVPTENYSRRELNLRLEKQLKSIGIIKYS